MPTVSLKVPTLVKEVKIEGQRYYHIRPLFTNYPATTNYRYETALAQFRKELKNYFKGFELDRGNMNQLLWFLFNPTPKYELVPIEFKLGSRFLEGAVGSTHFELQGLQFVVLPAIRNFMFISEGFKSKEEYAAEVQTIVKKKFKQFSKDLGNDFEVEEFLSNKKEFLSEVEVNVRIDFGGFKFENQGFNFFSEMGPSSDFNGAIEVEKVGQCLNYLYPSELKRAFLRDKEVRELYDLLFKNKQKQAIALVGEIGVGRHTMVHEAIWRYQSNFYGKVKQQRRQIWQIDPNRVIAGMSIVGMWQKRFESIISFIQKPFQDIKASYGMLIDNPVALMRVGKSAQNKMTLSDVLKPYLEDRSLQLTVIATPEEWKVVQEKDRRFADLFQVIRMQAANELVATKMVLYQRRELEQANNCQFTIQAINQLFSIHRMYMSQNALPGGVMKLMNQLAVKYKNATIDLPDVRKEFKSTSGLEERIFEDSEVLVPETVQTDLAAKVIGQDKAVESIANAVHLIKSKLNNPDRPISSYLFIGPTGVGKTQAAKVLCQYILGSEEHLLRFDMNEYIDGGAVDRLIGNEFNPEGILTGKVRYRSFGVLLLDEIEKAHPSVLDLLLQVLDDGRLTDSLGRVVNFSNFVIIMTSNAGANDLIRQPSTLKRSSAAQVYRNAIEKMFRPEFINRIDQVVIFESLEREHILGIARLQIKDLLQRDGFVRRTTILNISNETLNWVAQKGYDKSMGGRALKRRIEKELTALSADQLISINSNLPIILDIVYDKEQKKLAPNIHPLKLAQRKKQPLWMPQRIESKEAARYFYTNLLEQINLLGADLRDFRDENLLDEQDRFQYFQLTNQLTELKDSITFTRLRSGQAQAPYTNPIAFKKFNLQHEISDNSISGTLIFEIRENFRFADYLFDKEQAVFANYITDYLSLEANVDSFCNNNGMDRIKVTFTSYLDGFGEKEIAYLMKQFESLFNGIEATTQSDKKTSTIWAQGYGIQQLLKYEEGIHLFYFNYQTPIPIAVNFNLEGRDSNLEIIKIYDGKETVTDLRTGITALSKMTPNESKLMLLMGFPTIELNGQ